MLCPHAGVISSPTKLQIYEIFLNPATHFSKYRKNRAYNPELLIDFVI